MPTELETKPETQGDPPEKGKDSEGKSVAPKTYSEAEYLKAVSDERTKAGLLKVDLKKVTEERDTFKAQAEQAAKEKAEAVANVEDTKQQIADLEADLEQAMDSNPDAAEVQKIKRELRAEKAKLQADLKAEKEAVAAEKEAARKEREEWAVTVSEAQAMKFEVDVVEVAEEYENGDAARLKNLCEKANVKKREDIQGLADVLWTKKANPETEEEPAMLDDSGVTNGGGVDLDKLSPRELFVLGQKKKKK